MSVVVSTLDPPKAPEAPIVPVAKARNPWATSGIADLRCARKLVSNPNLISGRKIKRAIIGSTVERLRPDGGSCRCIALASDREEERQFLPKPSTLASRLLLADRGYPSTTYFHEVDQHGGSFIVRLNRSHNPWVNAAWLDGKRLALRTPVRLSQFIAQHTGRRMDPDVEYKRGKQVYEFRVVVLPGNEPSMTRLCTSLPRTPFSLDLVARLYRFRWQLELLFKEWKSYANLHMFNTPTSTSPPD